MKTEKITVFDLFEKQRRYLVPLFQRGYVWSKAGQWEPLWKDIIDQAAIVREQTTAQHRTVRKHFLGATVLSQAPTVIRQVAASEVIDGQQRLTTLQLFLAAFRDVVIGKGNEYLDSTLQRLTSNPGPYREEDERFKVWPTNAFREDFRVVLTAGSAEALASKFPQTRRYRKLVPPRPALVDAYLFFHEKITEYLEEIPDAAKDGPTGTEVASGVNGDRAEELLEAVTRHLQLVAIELDAEDDPQVIFETLNARGVELTPSDLIRNFVFLDAFRRGDNAEDLYNKWWREFDDPAGGPSRSFWKDEERQGRYKRSRLDLFVFHYVTCQTENEIKIKHIFQEFRDWWENALEKRSPSEELESLHRASGIYKALLVPDRQTRLGLFARRVRSLDTSTVYPLMLWLGSEHDRISTEEFDGILQDIESYLVRRAICFPDAGKGYNRIFLALLAKLRRAGLPNRTILQRELAALQGESSVWPEDAMFQTHFIFDPIYTNLGPNKTQMILEAIDLAHHTVKQEKQHLDGSLSVEHVMPQSADPNDWPFRNSMGDEDKRLAARDILRHSIGNLTLLTQYLNSSVSNGPFAQKRPAIALQSRLALNAYFQSFADADMWDEVTIVERSEKLAKIALEVWPHPGAAQTP